MKALKEVAASQTLYENPRIQRRVIGLLNGETWNPKWEELAEMLPYEDFYDQLLETTKVIAVHTHNRDAWLALAEANYNEDSKYGRWLSRQPEAIPAIIQLSDDKNDAEGSRAIGVMGYTIASCREDPALAICTPQLEQELLSIIRHHAETDPGVTPAAIDALGAAGTSDDIPLLETLRTKFRPPTDVKNATGWLVDHAEAAIRARAGK